MKHIYITLLISFSIYQFQAQIVNIPDANFKNLLVNDFTINTNFDDEIQVSEAEAALELYISYENIADLTGLEAFINLEILNLEGNTMPTIDLNSNVALLDLSIVNTPIAVLDISNNTALSTLAIGANNISNLDLSSNLDLLDIYIVNEPLTNLNLGNNTVLENLEVLSNVILTTLDVSSNTGLIRLEVVNNGMTSLDVTNNLSLEILRTYGNELTELDISNNIMLIELNTMYNQLSTLDLSNNPNLVWFNARNNQLETLDARNGNNDLFVNFNVINNPDLDCILVDDPTAPYLLSWLFDEHTQFGSTYENCQPLSINENKITNQVLHPNPVHNILYIESASNLEQVRIYDIIGQLIYQQHPETPTLQYEINLGHLKTGVYFIHLRTNYSEQIKRIVKI